MPSSKKYTKEQIREYNRKYRQEHLESEKQKQREYYRANREERLKKTAEWKRKVRKQIEEKLGIICVVCKQEKPVQYHNTKFISHENKSPTFILKHIEDFVPMCNVCHRALHHFKTYEKEFAKYLYVGVAK